MCTLEWIQGGGLGIPWLQISGSGWLIARSATAAVIVNVAIEAN